MAWSSASKRVGLRRERIRDTEELSAISPLIWRKRHAFQSLLQKFFPPSMRSSWKRMSCPWGAIDTMPKRRPSAPYFAMRSRGSGELPSDFDILRPSASRMMPVKYTSLNGMRCPIGWPGFEYSSPAMIMRATQKKMMSGPVTSVLVG